MLAKMKDFLFEDEDDSTGGAGAGDGGGRGEASIPFQTAAAACGPTRPPPSNVPLRENAGRPPAKKGAFKRPRAAAAGAAPAAAQPNKPMPSTWAVPARQRTPRPLPTTPGALVPSGQARQLEQRHSHARPQRPPRPDDCCTSRGSSTGASARSYETNRLALLAPSARGGPSPQCAPSRSLSSPQLRPVPYCKCASIAPLNTRCCPSCCPKCCGRMEPLGAQALHVEGCVNDGGGYIR